MAERDARLHRVLETPTGGFAIMSANGSIRLGWVTGPDDPALRGSTEAPSLADDLAGRLTRYFRGDDVTFEDLSTPAGSAFFNRCWDACRRIPRGETRSYAEVAVMAGGGRGSARAVGQAMRRNPLPIVIPCHRVVAADGRLHGFAGSRDEDGPEVARKHALLAMEGAAAGAVIAAR